MPPIPDEELTAAQREAVEEFRATRGEPGGPWAVILRSPELKGGLAGQGLPVVRWIVSQEGSRDGA